MKRCINCSSSLLLRHQIKFCSNQCQSDYGYKNHVVLWKLGKIDGNVGIAAKNLSGWLRKYLVLKYDNKCSLCGWNKTHPITGKVPLEIDHVDGNSENNKEENLRLLCPNCHSLTPFFKNLNKGSGRKWRMNKYIKTANY